MPRPGSLAAVHDHAQRAVLGATRVVVEAQDAVWGDDDRLGKRG